MAKIIKRKCGTCGLWSMWTGTCCQGGDFRDKDYNDKPCNDWELSEDYDADGRDTSDRAGYDPEDDHYHSGYPY